jgi:hypothetical protein
MKEEQKRKRYGREKVSKHIKNKIRNISLSRRGSFFVNSKK